MYKMLTTTKSPQRLSCALLYSLLKSLLLASLFICLILSSNSFSSIFWPTDWACFAAWGCSQGRNTYICTYISFKFLTQKAVLKSCILTQLPPYEIVEKKLRATIKIFPNSLMVIPESGMEFRTLLDVLDGHSSKLLTKLLALW